MDNDMKKLAGKTAFITGGNGGIGLAAAGLLQQLGASVAIMGRDRASLDAAATSLGAETLVLQGDVTRLADLDQAADVLRQRWDGLDILFANAGLANPAPFESCSEERFDETVAINFKGVFFTIQKMLPLLRSGASVIVTTSISNQRGAPNFSVYAACKAALVSLVQTLTLELAPRGIRINALSPGPIATPNFGTRWGVPPEAVQAAREEFIRKSPLKRFGTPDEVARAVLFLASEDSSYVAGTELVVDGAATVPML